MEPQLVEFKEKFLVDKLTIHKTSYWIWSLRPAQCTLGSGILSLKRYCERLSDITDDETLDLIGMIKIIERTLHSVFLFEKINYLMLMMVDTQLHYHVIPRYSGDREFAGLSWKDQGWPTLPILKAEVVSVDILIQIRDSVRSQLLKNSNK